MTLYHRGVRIGQVIRRKNVTTDASSTGWGAVCDGRPAFGTWSETEKSWHINCLELRAVHLALECFLPDILQRHVLIRTDSMTVVAFINHQGGVNSRPLLQLARDLLLWADRHLLSIRAVHVPGRLNYGVDLLSRGGIIHGEWILHPLTVNMIWSVFGRAEVDLFASAENTHCPLFYSLTHSPLGVDALAHSWPKYAPWFPELVEMLVAPMDYPTEETSSLKHKERFGTQIQSHGAFMSGRSTELANGSAELLLASSNLQIIYLFGFIGLVVRGPSGPLVAPLGSSVVLPCYVDELLLMEDLEVEWRRTDSETLVHLYQDGESRAEAQQQDYHDRAHFFIDQIQHGNFSLRLDNLRAEDEGRYTCTVHSQQESGETVVDIKDVERLLVSGSSRSISASEDVTLNCSVDSHITPEHIEEVSWKKTDEDEDILVLLYQNNKTLPDSSDEQYRDRVEFFTAEIPKGNFSLRLKSVRTEDKGVYMCQVFAGGLSANATIVLERLVTGFSVSHIMVLILCIAASGSALLLCCLIYCRSPYKGFIQSFAPLGSSVVLPCYVDKSLITKDLKIQHGNFSLHLDNLRRKDEGEYTCTVHSQQDHLFSTKIILEMGDYRSLLLQDSFFHLQMFLVICPNIIMFFAFVLWGVSEGSVNESVCCCALYFLRPLILLWAFPYANEFTGNIKTWIQKYSYCTEYLVLSVVVY
ncbi:uncharacterized protein LOC131535672 [Onychostoma macrolepis]|uniref:uncharacterized protein LOC131535672 n=1 Tax=Onychostoma macrolepis TaxID=369639 RepID=UPI00272A8258|nr:uncharacterized protein LOC131535672 [Onychostoma macrolepis]